jgi:ElaB/YqjD/DUF883 family membrane-anchored ribosome-binding protein
MATVTESAVKAIKDYADPALAAVEGSIRDVRRAAVAGSYAIDDYADEAKYQIRRRPFRSIGIAIGTGAMVGCLIGFVVGRACRNASLR